MIRLHLRLTALAAGLSDALGRLREEEDGLTTTEVAVINFLLVGAAIVVTGIIYVAAQNYANSSPFPPYRRDRCVWGGVTRTG